jgi:hypothetical protein
MRTNTAEEIFSNPIDLSEVLSICKHFSLLGYNVQHQIELITEIGIDEAVKSGAISLAALPHIKDFLHQISQNFLLGDAANQAVGLLYLIDAYELSHPTPSPMN